MALFTNLQKKNTKTQQNKPAASLANNEQNYSGFLGKFQAGNAKQTQTVPQYEDMPQYGELPWEKQQKQPETKTYQYGDWLPGGGGFYTYTGDMGKPFEQDYLNEQYKSNVQRLNAANKSGNKKPEEVLRDSFLLTNDFWNFTRETVALHGQAQKNYDEERNQKLLDASSRNLNSALMKKEAEYRTAGISAQEQKDQLTAMGYESETERQQREEEKRKQEMMDRDSFKAYQAEMEKQRREQEKKTRDESDRVSAFYENLPTLIEKENSGELHFDDQASRDLWRDAVNAMPEDLLLLVDSALWGEQQEGDLEQIRDWAKAQAEANRPAAQETAETEAPAADEKAYREWLEAQGGADSAAENWMDWAKEHRDQRGDMLNLLEKMADKPPVQGSIDLTEDEMDLWETVRQSMPAEVQYAAQRVLWGNDQAGDREKIKEYVQQTADMLRGTADVYGDLPEYSEEIKALLNQYRQTPEGAREYLEDVKGTGEEETARANLYFVQRRAKYEALDQQPDFAEKSKRISDEEIIKEADKNAAKDPLNNALKQEDAALYRKINDGQDEYYSLMEPVEIARFNYLWQRNKEEAKQYLEDMMYDLGERFAAKQQEYYRAMGAQGGWGAVGASLDSIPMAYAGSFAAPGKALQYIRNKIPGQEYRPIMMNSSLSVAAKAAQAGREGTMEGVNLNIGGVDVFDKIYSPVMSLIDAGLVAKTGALLGGGATEKAEKIAAAIMGSSAAGNTMQELKANGANDDQMIFGGVLAGYFENLFEKKSIGVFFDDVKQIGRRTFGEKAYTIIKEAIVNAVEEGNTEIADIALDTIVMGKNSKLNKRKEYYEDHGYGPEEAQKLAARDMALEVYQAAEGGLIMGTFAGAGANYGSSRATKRVDTYAGEGIIQADTQQTLKDIGMTIPEGSKARKAAESFQPGKAKAKDVGALYREIYTMLNGSKKLQQAMKDRMTRDVAAKMTSSAAADGGAAASAIVSLYSGEEITPEQAQAIAQNQGAMAAMRELMGVEDAKAEEAAPKETKTEEAQKETDEAAEAEAEAREAEGRDLFAQANAAIDARRQTLEDKTVNGQVQTANRQQEDAPAEERETGRNNEARRQTLEDKAVNGQVQTANQQQEAAPAEERETGRNSEGRRQTLEDKMVNRQGQTVREEEATPTEQRQTGQNSEARRQTLEDKSVNRQPIMEVKAEGKPAQVETVTEDRDGGVTVRLADGQEKSLDEIDADDNQKELLNQSSSLPAEDAPGLVNNYQEGQDAQTYGIGYKRIYNGAKRGQTLDEIHSVFGKSELTDAQQRAAWEAGKRAAARAQQAAAQKNAALAQKEGFQTPDTENAGQTGVIFAGVTKALSKSARKQLQMIDLFARAHGLQVRVYDTLGEDNGSYKTGTNIINVALDADAGALTRTVSHEGYHFLKNWNAEAAQKIQALVIDTLRNTEGYDLDGRVKAIMEKYGLKEDDALEEITADAMLDVIGKEDTLNRLLKEDKGLARKILDWLADVIGELRGMLEKLGKYNPEVKAMLGQQIETLEGLQSQYLDGLQKAEENYRAAQEGATRSAQEDQNVKDYMEAMQGGEDRQTALNGLISQLFFTTQREWLQAHPDADLDEALQRFADALMQYRKENTALRPILENAGFAAPQDMTALSYAADQLVGMERDSGEEVEVKHNRKQDESIATNGIYEGMSDESRHYVLKNASAVVKNADGIIDGNDLKNYDQMNLSQAGNNLADLAKQYDLIDDGKKKATPLQNNYLKVAAHFSKTGLNESLHWQQKNFGNLAALIPVFRDTFENAIPILTAKDRYLYSSLERTNTKTFAYLLGAFEYNGETVPVQFEIKQNANENDNNIYVVATIKKDAIKTGAGNKSAPTITASFTKSIQEIIAHVNPEDTRILANIPAQFLTAEQLAGKREGLKNKGEHTREKAMRKGKDVNAPVNMTTERIDTEIKNYESSTNPNYSNAYMVYINPNDFLDLTTANRQKIDNESRAMNAAEMRGERQTPFLMYDEDTGEITGYEGRHRMAALANAGVQKVAVLMLPDGEKGRGNRQSVYSLQVTGKNFGKTQAPGVVNLNNLIPVNSAHRQELIDTFGDSKNWFKYSKKLDIGAEEVTLPSLNLDPAYAFKGTDAEVDAADRKVADRQAEIRDIIQAPRFRGLQITKPNGQTEILTPSIRPGVKWQLSYYGTDSIANMHENYGQTGAEPVNEAIHTEDELYRHFANMTLRRDLTMELLGDNTTQEDIRHSRKAEDVVRDVEEDAALYAQVQSDRDAREALGLMQRLDESVRDAAKGAWKERLGAIADKILQETGSDMTKRQLMNRLRTLFTAMDDAQMSLGEKIMYARTVLKDAVRQTGMALEMDDGTKEALRLIKNRGFFLTDDQKSEIRETYGDVRTYIRKNFGRAAIRAKGSFTMKGSYLSLTDLWGELNEVLPGTFRMDIPEVDMPGILDAFLDSARNRDYSPAFGADAEAYITDAAYRTLLEYYDVPTAFRKTQDIRKEFRQKLEDYKATYKTKQEKKMQASQDRAAATERKNKLRGEISRDVKYLNIRNIAPTDSRHIPQGLREAAIRAVAPFTEANGVWSSEDASRLAREYSMLGDQKANSAMDAARAYDPEIEEKLQHLAQMLDGRRLSELTEAELEDVRDIVGNLKKMIEGANEMHVRGRTTTLDAEGEAFIQAMNERKRIQNKALKKLDDLTYKNMTPAYYADRVGGIIKDMVQELYDGQNKWAFTMKAAKEKAEEIAEKYKLNDWINGPTLQFDTQRGEKIELSVGEALALYATWKRETTNRRQNANHLRIGGFTYGDKANYKGVDLKAPHAVTAADMQKVMDFLGTDKMAFADEMVKYLSEDMARLGNETSMALYGYEKFGEAYYFPYNSDRNYLDTELTNDSDKSVRQIKKAGFSQRTVAQASNPVKLGDFLTVWADHVNQMALYHAFAETTDNLDRLYNYKTAAKAHVDSKTGVEHVTAPRSVKQAMEAAMGQGAVKYLQTLVKDINGGVAVQDRTGMGKALSLFKKGSVAANASVTLQQPSAIMRAMNMIAPKYFLNQKPAQVKQCIREMGQYSGVAIIKDMGRFDTGTGRSGVEWLNDYVKEGNKLKQAYNVMDKLSGWAPEVADRVTWGNIWQACKNEVAAKMPGIDADHEAYMQAVAARFNDVVNHTQVYDSTLSKSSMMRSQGMFDKLATSFMAEPTVAFNMLLQAVENIRQPGGKAKAARAMGAFVAAAILNSLLKSLVTAGRRKDDDERTIIEKYLAEVVENAGDDLSLEGIIGLVPIARDAVSIFQGYDVNRSDMDVVQQFYDAYKTLKNENKTFWDKTKAVAGAVGNATGVPVKNVVRDVEGMLNLFRSAPIGETSGRDIKYSMLDSLPGGWGLFWDDSRGAYYRRINAAAERGDTEAAEEMRGYMQETEGVKEQTMNTGLRTAAKEDMISGRRSEEDTVKLLTGFLGMGENDAYFKLKEWQGGEEYKKYGDLTGAIERGDGISEAVKELTDHGVKKETISSQITQEFKPKYIELSKTNPVAAANLKAAILAAYQALGYDRNKKNKDIDKWLEEKKK